MRFLPSQENLSGRPGSNRRHSAWKADALPTELLPHFIQISKLQLFKESLFNELVPNTEHKIGLVLQKRAFELKFLLSPFKITLWGEQDSNLRRRKSTDLQSVLVGRLSISPLFSKIHFF